MIRDDLPASYLLCSILTVPMAIDIAQVREMLSVRAADDTQLQVMRLEQLAAFSGHAASAIDEKLLRLAAFPDRALLINSPGAIIESSSTQRYSLPPLIRSVIRTRSIGSILIYQDRSYCTLDLESLAREYPKPEESL
ncbi:MAG: hypothetical protein K9M84_00195 [Spirochaetia bacterium]|nr:hypothetical protein [Spirochaetia bacterium]MCF7940006.1 hypothetical protein [Spirochaetia bacterium]